MAHAETVEIDETTHHALHEISQATGESVQTILAQAIEEYRRKHLFDQAATAYAALRNDATAWQAELDERALWENTLQDDLEQDEEWTQGGEGAHRG